MYINPFPSHRLEVDKSLSLARSGTKEIVPASE